MSLLEIVAAGLLTLGSALLIRALIAADRVFASAEPSSAHADSQPLASSLRRAA